MHKKRRKTTSKRFIRFSANKTLAEPKTLRWFSRSVTSQCIASLRGSNAKAC
ncbi:UNVERIFIED_CONTAM: hypothetical protein GTU68_057282 [Idotea baltica]|nr:hypothetical protein [Idotea baltica]